MSGRSADGWFVDGGRALRDGLHTLGHGLGGPADGVYRARERTKLQKKVFKYWYASKVHLLQAGSCLGKLLKSKASKLPRVRVKNPTHFKKGMPSQDCDFQGVH